ncbi:hypothetical protein H4219_005522 [Mycoemilia scoparia]|uniref:chitin synthase n=1 Tax=Mycoemilia scoparia TaxID=417184 RepID=A0A9W7ZNY5_9FUNG|nr:hypothetical protein H4219_005522 [Mycoemilia scoparia]
MPKSTSESSRKSWVQPFNSNPSVPTMNDYNPGDDRQRLGDSYNSSSSSALKASSGNKKGRRGVPKSNGSEINNNNNSDAVDANNNTLTRSEKDSTLRNPSKNNTLNHNTIPSKGDAEAKSRGGLFGGWSKKPPTTEKLAIAEDPSDSSDNGSSGKKPKHETVEEIAITPSRRIWEIMTWALTWWIPSPLLSWLGRMKRPDIRMAWREKVAICIIIVFLWAVMLFVIIGLGLVLCPRQKVWSAMEVQGYNTEDKAFISMYGSVYDITSFIRRNHAPTYGTTWNLMKVYAGKDVNNSFPISIRLGCPGLGKVNEDKDYKNYYTVDLDDQDPDISFQHKPGTSSGSDELGNNNFFFKIAGPKLRPYRKGDVVWEKEYVKDMHKKNYKYWRIIDDRVYNFDNYMYTIKQEVYKNDKHYNIFTNRTNQLLDDGGFSDTDITELWNAEHLGVSPREFQLMNNCINNMFYVGKVDQRHSVRCLFANYMLLAFACVLMFVILSKFLAAMQFGTKKRPIPPQKHVICQVPCYTENEESLEVTLSSLAALDYNDKSKLIFVICDGNIVGSGNDRPTPRIVLDILGVDPEYDPPARDYLAIAEGSRRHNCAKVYSGLYEYEGHVVPYMVVAKVGTPDETSRAGNRGKRDSQIILMQFLNKVHFDLPMTPLELEIYHQMKHIIGIPPTIFEYVLQIDADTHVMEDSLSRLVAACTSDSRIAGICGETMLGNENKSWTTMMQVYEYFISHHMAKAFESLFGSVTCLPGCFCMYRILSKQGKPLLIAEPVVTAYSELHVDTLHKKNLLSLGEDRYLTTLMMKHFPTSKLKFIRDAKCQTIAPEKWEVLLSQRRRWINSTIHNLVELLYLPDMCGFCCFSMRFVVFIDLFSTLTMPTTLIYFGVLIYLTIANITSFSYISLILIGAIYGFQAVIFILRREWQHIGWMIIYLLAYPLWSFVLPVYSFWHFDDFSWGNTRVVVGEGKRKMVISDDKEFDPNSIPQRRWQEYEQELAMLGLLNAPPPNMNLTPHDEDRMSMVSRLSRPMSAMPPGSHPQQNYNNMMMMNQMHHNMASTPIPPPHINSNPRMTMAGGPDMTMMMPPYDPRISNVQQMMMVASAPSPVPHAIAPGYNPSMMMGAAGNSGVPHDTSSVYVPPASMTNAALAGGVDGQFAANLQGGGTPGLMQSGILPNDEQLTESIRQILMSSDLQSITKKKVREQLTLQYGVDLTARKEFISDAIELILNNQL